MSLHPHHALVTGGSRGIGAAIAASLARAGAKVTVLGRDKAALDAVVATGHAHFAVLADVADEGATAHAIAAAAAHAGPIDILVANAGSAISAPFLKSEPELFRRMLDVNLMGVIHSTRPVLGPMMERGFGRIVAIASIAGLKGYAYVSAYCAAKHAVVGLVRALAAEAAASGVTVNAVCPGYTDTDLVADSVERIIAKTGRGRAEVLAELVKHNPQRRLIDPREIAATVLWLCGVEARSVNGQAIAIAGGEV